MTTTIRKNFTFPFKRSKDIESLEKEIEKRISNDIELDLGNYATELGHFKDEVQLTPDPKKKNSFMAKIKYDEKEFNLTTYLHGLYHLDRITAGVPRLVTENTDYGMYIDNCIEHCIIIELVAMHDPDAFKKHKDEILKCIQIENLKRYVEEDFEPIQKLQLAALMTELAYLHSVDKEANAMVGEVRMIFPSVEQMRKGIVRYISVKGISTPQAKFGVVEGLWTILGKPTDKFCNFTHFTPKFGFQTFKISDGYK
jgi:hypothetical protein